MDSGCLAPGETFQDTYDVSRELEAEEVIGIMDELLCHEVYRFSPPRQVIATDSLVQVAWHMGYPLSQSLFTSVYIDKLLWPEPKSLKEARFLPTPEHDAPLWETVLRAYCLAQIKCCDFVHKQISSEHCYEVRVTASTPWGLF